MNKSPEEVSTLILTKLREAANNKTNGECTNCVVTVPAYFSHSQKSATKKACEEAGLNCKRIINEPTAAAIHYANKNKDQNKKILIFDFGGGTFDVSIV